MIQARLANKVALVTGAAKRLGKASALALAGAGADVAITYLHSRRDAERTARQISSLGGRALAIPCDVTDPASVRQAVKAVARELGGIDVLVNNAASYGSASFEELTVQEWDSIFATNVRGPFLVSKEALSLLRARKGRIINLGSLGGVRAWGTHAHYCSSKAALHMLTRAMARALAPEIAVNCVAPGMIDLGDRPTSALMKKLAKQTPVKRNGSAEDVVSAVLFFAQAPHFITGQILAVDGGLGL